jgi:predicted nucleotidyltransferase
MNSSLRVVMPEARRGFDEAAGYAVTEGETHPQREPPMHRLIEAKRPEIAALCRRFGVQRLEVFGSAARGDDFDTGRSDADFLVEFAPEARNRAFANYFDFKEALEALLGRPVDLVMPGAVENPYLRAGIERSREPVFAA